MKSRGIDLNLPKAPFRGLFTGKPRKEPYHEPGPNYFFSGTRFPAKKEISSMRAIGIAVITGASFKSDGRFKFVSI